METFVSTSPPLEASASASASTVDELTMQQSLLFSDSLEDLKMLRSQLYSAAEYFESTYTDDDQKQIVVNTLKDYAVKALVNTVDHLGSISFKVNGLLHRKFDEVSETELRVSCIERRIRACQEHTDRQGLSQQSLVITAPKFYKRYTLPAAGGGSMPESGSQAVPKHQELDRFQDSAEAHQFQAEIRQKTKDKPPSFRKRQSIRIKHSQRARSSSPAPKVRSQSPSSQPAKVAGGDKRADSPIPTSNAVTRSGSIVRKPSLLKSSSVGVQYPSETQKLASMRLHAERTDDKDSEQNPSKGRKFLKSLLSRRKSRKDEMLYSYLDEY